MSQTQNPPLTDRELLEKIYWARGYCSEQDFYDIEARIGQSHPIVRPSRYDPSPERDPDKLYQEIKRLQQQATVTQNLLARVFRELKEKR